MFLHIYSPVERWLTVGDLASRSGPGDSCDVTSDQVQSLCLPSLPANKQLKLEALDITPQVQHLLLLPHLLLLEGHLVGFLLHSPLLIKHRQVSTNQQVPALNNISSRFTPSHLALFLDGLFPCLPLVLALLLVAGLGGDAGQVRVVDP